MADGFIALANADGSSNVSVDSGSSGVCVLCGVQDDGNLIDENLDNAARMNTTVGLLGGASFITVTDGTQSFSGDRRVGFVVSQPDALLTLDVIRSLDVTLFNDGSEVANSSDTGLLNLDLLGLIGDNRRQLLLVTAPEEFDSVRLRLNGAVNVLSNLDVYSACVQNGTIPEGGEDGMGGAAAAVTDGLGQLTDLLTGLGNDNPVSDALNTTVEQLVGALEQLNPSGGNTDLSAGVTSKESKFACPSTVWCWLSQV